MNHRRRFSVLHVSLAMLAALALFFLRVDEEERRPRKFSKPHVEGLSPENAVAETPFSLRKTGESTLIIRGAHFLPKARVYLGETVLQSVFLNESRIKAYVPPKLIAAPGVLQLVVENVDRQKSEGVFFAVQKKAPESRHPDEPAKEHPGPRRSDNAESGSG